MKESSHQHSQTQLINKYPLASCNGEKLKILFEELLITRPTDEEIVEKGIGDAPDVNYSIKFNFGLLLVRNWLHTMAFIVLHFFQAARLLSMYRLVGRIQLNIILTPRP